MENLAVHMRIVGSQVSNEDVDTRRLAIKHLSAEWQKGAAIEKSLATANGIAQALHGEAPCAELGKEIQAAVQKHASAFLYEESPFEVSIVAGMAFAEIVKAKPGATSEWTTPEVLSAAVWSALSYQQPLAEAKREALRSEVLKAAEGYVSHAAEASRARSPVDDFETLTITLVAPMETDGQTETDAEALPTASSNFAKATQATITALRRNAALDREELDFLWWAQLGRSRLLGKQLVSLAEPVRMVAEGIEGAAHLRRLPCEVHRDIVLKTLDKDPELDLKKLLSAIGADREKMGARYADGWATKWPAIFPLLNALATGRADGPEHSVKRRASTWGARAMLEAGMIQYFRTGAAKL
ncbi:GTPase-associated system all-helical protein GASH [Mesorhizobium sp. L2C085B000]|uniref:GTPase-associated system all-helical protein GASH n=1 Tax=Mesorhizobium sp. L2C085B000 TaxID=1287117 RepID=UPI0004CE22B7|nr:GTPase-associated system all-helical protein GASH [Mesorhizobium sp. L2C085B000]